jgi:FAS-associated factor 2
MRNTTGRRPLNPRDTAARFAREFEEEYGSHSLLFYENGYAQALDLAKKDLKFLLVVLMSPEHDDTVSFVKDTLLSSEVVEYINNPQNNVILWAGNVQDSEAYQVSTALNCTKFPFSALITHTPQAGAAAMSVVARITGPVTPTAYIAKIQAAISQHSEALSVVRAARAAQDFERNLRVEQDSAYERSLARDRERARQRREAEEARQRAEKAAKEKALAAERYERDLLQWRLWRARSILPEPGRDDKETVRIVVRMPPPSEKRVIRKFANDAPLEELYAFVECYDVLTSQSEEVQKSRDPPANFKHQYSFQLVSPLPREVYALEGGGTIRERIGRSGNLIVERTGKDDDDDDEEDD